RPSESSMSIRLRPRSWRRRSSRRSRPLRPGKGLLLRRLRPSPRPRRRHARPRSHEPHLLLRFRPPRRGEPWRRPHRRLSPPARRRAPPPPAPAAPTVDEGRMQVVESRLLRAEDALSRARSDKDRAEEAAAQLAARLEAIERSARDLGRTITERQDGLSQRLETPEKSALGRHEGTEARVWALEER